MDSASARCFRPVGMCPYLPPRTTTLVLLIRFHWAGCFLAEGRAVCARACLVGGCGAMLISSSLTMGARAATPCGRSLSGGATPSTYEGWVCLSLRGKSPWLECTPAGQSAYCLVTMGVCPSPFPLNCYVSACSFESHAVWHLLALRRGVLSMPELLRRLALAVRCGTLAPAVRGLSSGSSREKLAFPPWLLSSRCSNG